MERLLPLETDGSSAAGRRLSSQGTRTPPTGTNPHFRAHPSPPERPKNHEENPNLLTYTAQGSQIKSSHSLRNAASAFQLLEYQMV